MIPWAAIDVAFRRLPPRMDSPEARVMLIAIGLQESRFTHRRQINGPARGFWQFERTGGVQGVLQHSATTALAAELCKARGMPAYAPTVWAQLEHDDVLAAGFARLLLWTDPARLPMLGDSAGAWGLYLRTWRPGKPHPETWAECYARAVREVAGATL